MKFNEFKLTNGTQVIMAPLKETQAVTVLVLVPAGSRYEQPATNGVAHFIEHLMFKGTDRRPTALDISKELDGVGATYNAFTGKEYTGYYIKIASQHLELGLDVLSDMLFASSFKKEEIERERGVILEEIKMYQDNPLLYIEDLFEQTIYQGNPLGWSIAGEAPGFKKITRPQIITFKDRHYQPRNLLVVLAGQLDGAPAKKLLQKYFGTRPNHARDKKSTDFTKIKITPHTAPKINFRRQKSEQVQIALGFPAYQHNHPRHYALDLLSIILGGNMSSRLFIKVRERNGLAYHIHAEANSYRDVGDFVIRAGVGQGNVTKALELISSELRDVLKNGVTEQELDRAKEFLKGKITLSLEDSAKIAEWYAQQRLFSEHILNPEQKIAHYNLVSSADIQQVARQIFLPRHINLALIGPTYRQEALRRSLEL